MNVISASSITGSALDAEKMRVDIVSQNIANANTTKGIDGKAYQRRIVAFKRDENPGEIINNPEHPHADKDGNVAMPNVNIPFEMVDMVTATRSYEANLAVVRNARQMATQALSIGR
jgi:flagellar basal-body rod protein FlgC